MILFSKRSIHQIIVYIYIHIYIKQQTNIVIIGIIVNNRVPIVIEHDMISQGSCDTEVINYISNHIKIK